MVSRNSRVSSNLNLRAYSPEIWYVIQGFPSVLFVQIAAHCGVLQTKQWDRTFYPAILISTHEQLYSSKQRYFPYQVASEGYFQKGTLSGGVPPFECLEAICYRKAFAILLWKSKQPGRKGRSVEKRAAPFPLCRKKKQNCPSRGRNTQSGK